jgi:hypothetical protein
MNNLKVAISREIVNSSKKFFVKNHKVDRKKVVDPFVKSFDLTDQNFERFS